MAYNASVYAMNDPRQTKIAVKSRAQHEYFLLGKDYAERGVANVPNSYLLHQRLALIYKDKLQDHCAASAEFEKASECPRAFSYEKRFAAYELSWCPGHEREAWERLRKLYDMGPRAEAADPRNPVESDGGETSVASRTKGLQTLVGGLV